MYHGLLLPLVTTIHPRDNFCLASKAMPILRLQKLHSKQIRIKMQCVTTLSLVLYLDMDMLLVLVMTNVQTFKKDVNILERCKILLMMTWTYFSLWTISLKCWMWKYSNYSISQLTNNVYNDDKIVTNNTLLYVLYCNQIIIHRGWYCTHNISHHIYIEYHKYLEMITHNSTTYYYMWRYHGT